MGHFRRIGLGSEQARFRGRNSESKQTLKVAHQYSGAKLPESDDSDSEAAESTIKGQAI
jgi:hypothetical protein